MRITCPHAFQGQPELDTASTLWVFIANADKLRCVLDGDTIQVAAVRGTDETPLAEVGIGLWQKRGVLGEVLAGYAPRNGDNYRGRLKVFAGKPVEWLGEPELSSVTALATTFPSGAKVYFGRGPMEFVGTVAHVAEDGAVVADGVEIGCDTLELERTFITAHDHLRVIDDAEWKQRTQNEPAFTGQR